MKTSFANTFQDIIRGKETKDRVFNERNTIREVLCDGKHIQPETIFVTNSYNNDYESEKISTLLASKKLKKKYDNIHNNIDEIKNKFFDKLRQLSKKKDKNTQLEDYILSVFEGENFYDTILTLEDKISKNESPDFCNIDYNTIFNDKVKNLLKQDTIKNNLEEYINKYNELTEQSKFLNKDFKFHNADNLIKPLEDNNFFNAKHSINLSNDKDKKTISTLKELKKILEDEKNKIFNNEDLKKIFDTLKKEIKNNDLRNFREHIQNNPEILPELDNIAEFKKKVWVAYFTMHEDLFFNLVTAYKDGQKEIEKIITEVKQKTTEWEQAVSEFNNRFVDLPFELQINNKEDVILKGKIPVIEFIFKDGGEQSKYKEKKELLKILSTGETRALYILNIIFEVEARKKIKKKLYLLLMI
jgi:hypothetical protein